MRPMPKFRPYDRPWVDPEPDIMNMPGMRVPFVSWVPHWLATVTKKWFWIWTLCSIVSFAFALWTGWWLFDFVGYLIFIIPVGVMEIERWNNVYTLIDDGTLYRLSSSIENWRPDTIIYNLRKSLGQSLNEEMLLAPFGCIRKSGITAEGGGGMSELKWIPWIGTLKRVFDEALAPGELPNNLWFLSGIHWLHGIEIYMFFLNKLGDIFDAAKNSWDWLDPNIRVEDAEFKINRKWPIDFRADKKTLDLHKKTDKAFFLSYWLWQAWQKYQEVLPKPYIRSAEQARLNHLQEMIQISGLSVSVLVSTPKGHAWLMALDSINNVDRPFMPAVQAWLGQACSPFSETWKTMTLPALESVMPMWGSLTTPGPGTAMFKRKGGVK